MNWQGAQYSLPHITLYLGDLTCFFALRSVTHCYNKDTLIIGWSNYPSLYRQYLLSMAFLQHSDAKAWDVKQWNWMWLVGLRFFFVSCRYCIFLHLVHPHALTYDGSFILEELEITLSMWICICVMTFNKSEVLA